MPYPGQTPERDVPSLPEREMRIALVLPSLSVGGTERFVCELSRRWLLRGHEVSVVTWWPRSGDLLDLSPGVHRVALDVGMASRNFVHGALLAGSRVRAFRRAFRQLRPDVVVSFLHHTNEAAILAASGTGIPVLVCERSDPRHDHVTPHWALMRRALYPRAVGVVVQTESVATWARAFCPRVHVIPNFVNRPLRHASPGDDRGRRTLVAAGRLAPEKGFDLLIEAFARIAEAFGDWLVTIYGEGPERPRLERMVAVRGLQGRVSMPGRTSEPELALSRAEAFVLPSRYEGFPNALLEAMACGLPVVAFDCDSGPAEIITHGHNGLLVPGGDVSALAAALGQVLASGAERERLGQNARAVADRFAVDPIIERWSRLLTSVGQQN
jgi:glycosyltransferase involved in cell wall biosynthesis